MWGRIEVRGKRLVSPAISSDAETTRCPPERIPRDRLSKGAGWAAVDEMLFGRFTRAPYPEP